MDNKRLCMLMILDGWGVNPAGDGNAVKLARTPFLSRLEQSYPHTLLDCSGGAVGLPDGIMGNSEVGHLNIGAGRIVYQDLLRIDRAIEDRTFFENPELNSVMDAVKDRGSALHLMGLVSDGGVHSQLTHLFALLDMAGEKGLDRVYVHAILDGRDTSPEGGAGYLEQLQDHIHRCGVGIIASVCGRYYAMDRDRRWDRTEKAYRLYTMGEGRKAADPVAAVRESYAKQETDEFVLPIAITAEGEADSPVVKDNDGLIFFNFRADRARQITRAFTDSGFSGFHRETLPKLCGYICMTLFDEDFDLPIAFAPVHLNQILGEVLSNRGMRQLRIAETEKYAHVTYFFNGGEETPFPLEDRCLIPSPREVATYDQKPEMSAPRVTEEVLARIRSGDYDVIILNFANMDMVGHTGVIEAAVEAVETVDRCAEKIVGEILARGGVAMITADHGNAEKMVEVDGRPHTAHTTNKVPFYLVDDSRSGARLRPGILADISPTILDILNVDPPEEMTGLSLLKPV